MKNKSRQESFIVLYWDLVVVIALIGNKVADHWNESSRRCMW